MDNIRFKPDGRVTVLALVGAVAAVLLTVFAGDGPSRLLFGLAVVVLLAFAISDRLYSPRLEASADGVTVRSPLLRTRLLWADIEVVRVDTRARLGLRSTTLEVDAGETLAVFSRRSLGADPEDAARRINALRPLS